MTSNPFFKSYLPQKDLECIVRDIQVLHVVWRPGMKLPPPFITCLANTDQNLYFYPHDPVKTVTKEKIPSLAPGAVLTGPKTKPVGIIYNKDYLMIRVSFHPTGLFRLLGLPMQPLVNEGPDATEFFGRNVTVVLNSLRKTTDYDKMVAIITAFLQTQIKEKLLSEEPIDQVAIAMLDPARNFSTKQWSVEACLSVRQFERNFERRTGISPKLFTRIVRFEQAMKVKNTNAGKSWADIALECGYTDSAHILKEFKSFAEFPPSGFFLQPTSGFSELPTG
jgi:AraC-like DNA-binding protein